MMGKGVDVVVSLNDVNRSLYLTDKTASQRKPYSACSLRMLGRVHHLEISRISRGFVANIG
jgi:hypothetical protein